MPESCFDPFAPIGVIDSGVGGVTTLGALVRLLPHENFIYLADKAGAPYGDKSTGYILARTMANCFSLVKMGAKAIVVACNTATNVGIMALRQTPSPLAGCIFIGVEPAIKPALSENPHGNVLVLLTPATARQQKFRELMDAQHSQRIIISPQKNLATLVEQNLSNLDALNPHIQKILSRYENISAVVLGCTHYIYLKDQIQAKVGSKTKIYDGNQGTANHLAKKLQEKNLINPTQSNGWIKLLTT